MKSKKNTAKKHSRGRSFDTSIMDSPRAVLTVVVLSILMGIIFIVSQSSNKPVSRDEAVAYSGEFQSYEAWSKNYRSIEFKDGSSYDVYAHTETQEFRKKMESLEEGTVLYILVNPNNDYVAEIKTDSEEILNFEESQKAIDSYDNGYIVIGVIILFGAAFLIVYVIISGRYKRKENARHQKKSDRRDCGKADLLLRQAEPSLKSRILLEANVKGYKICYRRVKSVNELIINGNVYDEVKGVLEFSHNLNAIVDGHKIEAGFDDNSSYSYIIFDGKRIAEKKRLI